MDTLNTESACPEGEIALLVCLGGNTFRLGICINALATGFFD